MKDSFILYASYEDKFNMLNEKDRGKLISALFAFIRGEDCSKDLSPISQMAYAFITQQIAIDTAKYKEICEKRKANGLLGGRPKKGTEEDKTNGLNEKPKKANGLSNNQMVFEETKQNHNDNEYEYENDLEVSKQVSKKEKDKIINNTHAREYELLSYNEVMDNLEVSAQVKSMLVEFIKHCQVNGKIVTNNKLENIIIRLDSAYGKNENSKIESLRTAINSGCFDIAELR